MPKNNRLDIFFITNTTKMPIGDQIRTLLDNLDMTQDEFAKKVGSNQRTISRYINEESTPNYKLVESIIIAFPSLSTEWLTRGIGPMWKNEKDKSSSSQQLKSTGSDVETPKGDEWQDMTVRQIGELLNKLKDK